MNSADKIRLDNLLVSQGFYQSRARARDAIARGCVTVDGKQVTRAGSTYAAGVQLAIKDDVARYVSRAALKLIKGLELSGFDPSGKIALDVGASTGGFTQVLAERGACHIHAIDVGHGQMDARVSSLANVCNIEGLNARELALDHLGGERPDLIVCDVSFISLKLALPPALELARPGAEAILLVKPQFEVGKENLGKKGIVRDPELGRKAADEIAQWLEAEMGWTVIGIHDSPIAGGDGNQEYLVLAKKGEART